jgi:hypothetical protein
MYFCFRNDGGTARILLQSLSAQPTRDELLMSTSTPKARFSSRRTGADRRAKRQKSERRNTQTAFTGKDRRSNADRRKGSRRSGRDRRDEK